MIWLLLLLIYGVLGVLSAFGYGPLGTGKTRTNISNAHVVKVYSGVPAGFNPRQRLVIN